MIFHDVEGQSAEWHALRLGIPTSSEFHKIMTPKTRKLSAQASGYMYRLLAEWLTGSPVENFQSEWMERGQEMEDQAVSAYELLTGAETKRGGFITTDDGMLGCSPDRLIGDDGDLELKCPLIQTQVQYALEGSVGEDYACQLQGRMLITGRQWVDIFSYHPRLSIPPLRVLRNEDFIGELRGVLKVFVELMLQKRVELEQRFGPFVRYTDAPPVADHSGDELGEAEGEAIISHIMGRQ